MTSSLRCLCSKKHIFDTLRTPYHAAVSLQFVRWRMHRGVPRPLHKLEKKIGPKINVEDEYEKTWKREMHKKYRSQMNALRSEIVRDTLHWLGMNKVEHLMASQKTQMAEWEESHKLNDLWNAEIAKQREERMMKERRKVEAANYQKMVVGLRKREIRREMAESFLGEYSSMITPDNLDEKIREALDAQVQHSRPLDNEGKPEPIMMDMLYNQVPEDETWKADSEEREKDLSEDPDDNDASYLDSDLGEEMEGMDVDAIEAEDFNHGDEAEETNDGQDKKS
ncbi:probable 28S ribosomal protein S26, mitochondrial [Lingula anatina]|uniref:Small ribosomal subunit protein mS26 n=1 Tax=Lingula anatina TaxID=7574 RepID=A0A1S3IIW6_LINAN|nr:probable 28S ribosomal protein S26, mitochondrial [Lingula anatina]|eukprot:XP_013397831.1 probable 28S ribosomal protein S26, mitochondrial [Lingula anatina]